MRNKNKYNSTSEKNKINDRPTCKFLNKAIQIKS